MKVTIALILINTLVFFYMVFFTQPDEFVKKYGFDAKKFLDGEYYRMITAIFLHASIAHLASNIVALFFIGLPIENKFGKVKFLFTYFLSGIAGNASMLLPWFNSRIGIGASACISGLVGMGTFALPLKFVLFPSFIPFPFVVAGAIYLLVNLANLFEVSKIAYHAHLAGLLTGSIVGLAFTSNRKKKVIGFMILLLFLSTFPLFAGYFLEFLIKE